jgi:hypothetical protein
MRGLWRIAAGGMCVAGVLLQVLLPIGYTGQHTMGAQVPDAPHEVLVLLEPRLADEALAQLRAVAVVTQVLPPRLALVRADPETMGRAAQIAGVRDVYDDTPPELPPDLTPAERLFVSAWEARRQPKTRPGEGLPWDAPGFQPPDSPAHRR